MKHLLRAIVLCLVWLTAYAPASAFFTATNSDGVSVGYMELTSNTCEVEGLYGTLSYPYQITVPSTVTYNNKVYTVIAVRNSAFNGKGTIQVVSLPETITTIGESAFRDCAKLTTINLPSSLTGIGEYAFYGCKSLSSITLPSTMTSIGGYTFYGCEALSKIVLPSALTEIGNSAFYGCKSLTTITLPESLEVLGSNSFRNCTGLTTVYYNSIRCSTPGDGPGWGGSNYQSNTTLNKVVIGSRVKVIPKKLFFCTGITSLNLPISLERIEESAFDTCDKLSSIEIPNSVKSIAGQAFRDLRSMTYLDLGTGVEYIGDYAFHGCYNIGSITLPKSIKHLGKSPFRFDCISFYGYGASSDHRFLVHNDTLVQWAPKTIDEVYDVKIPENVKYIGSEAFSGWQYVINSVDIPETVLEIGSLAFNSTYPKTLNIPSSVIRIEDYAIDNRAMKSLVIPTTVKHLGRNAVSPNTVIMLSEDPSDITFEGQMNWSVLFVPKGSKSAYSALSLISNNEKIYEMECPLTDGQSYYGARGGLYKIDLPCTYVTYTRNFTKTTWQAFYVPYDMPYEDWAQYGDIARINNVHQFDTDDDGIIDETKIEFVKVKSGRLVPNIPYVFKPKETGEITFESNKCMLKAAPTENGYVDCSSTTTTYTLTGVYLTTSGLYSKGAYTLFDGAFRPIGADNVTLSPFRFYMTITPREGFYNDPNQTTRPQRIRIYVDGEEQTTGLEDLIIQPTDNGIYYDMQGRPVTNPTNGVYIKNGKKIFIHN